MEFNRDYKRYTDYNVSRREVIYAVHQIVSKIKHSGRTEVREAFLHASKLYEQFLIDMDAANDYYKTQQQNHG